MYGLGPEYVGSAEQNSRLLQQLLGGGPTAQTTSAVTASARQPMVSGYQYQPQTNVLATSSSAFVPGTPLEYQPIIQQAAERYGVPADLLSALLKIESGFNPAAVSPAGAQGIAQFMPGTAREYGIDPNDPKQAIPAAAQYLSRYQKEFGDWEKALASYNAGPGAVRRYGGIPPYKETESYVQKINKELAALGGQKFEQS